MYSVYMCVRARVRARALVCVMCMNVCVCKLTCSSCMEQLLPPYLSLIFVVRSAVFFSRRSESDLTCSDYFEPHCIGPIPAYQQTVLLPQRVHDLL